MSLQRNYYEVLGLPPGATSDQIKKKYRELARKFHPDVIQDKTLGQRVFSQINQAYRILGDPDRRAQYNTSLICAPPGKAEARTAPPPQSYPARPAPTKPMQPVPPSPQQAAQATSTGTLSGTAQRAHAVSGLLANADNAIMAGKPIEARAFCVKVLEIDPSNARALEMLGDALVLIGRPEDAAVQYRNALQMAPSSMIQSKLNRLEQAATPTRTILPQQEGEKPGGGLLGRLLRRK